MIRRFIVFTTVILTGLSAVLFFDLTAGRGSSEIGIAGQIKDAGHRDLAGSGAEARYAFAESRTGARNFYAENDAHRFRADFDDSGVKISAYENSWKFDWKLKSIGRGARQTALETGEKVKKGRRVEIAKAKIEDRKSKILTEWFENRPDGLEQGFIVYEKPAGDENLRLVLTTDSTARAVDGGRSLELSDRKNGRIMRYENLKVWDAENAVLAAAMRVSEAGEIFLEVEDRAAVYPVTIDPKFVQVQKLINGTPPGFGRGLAVSGDRLLIGASHSDTGRGSARLYTRTDNGWTGSNFTLIASNRETDDHFGEVMAMDGNIMAVSVPSRNSGRGVVFIYRHMGSSISLAQTITAPAADAVEGHNFGVSLALQNGTLLVGANGGGNKQGVYVYRDVGAFVFRKKLVPSESSDLPLFGRRIAYSGNTVAVSGGSCACLDETAVPNIEGGAVYVFTGSDTNWTQQARLTSPSAGFIGNSFDLEGDTLAISEQSIIPRKVHVYQRNGTFWIYHQALAPADEAPSEQYGGAVSISDGVIAVSDTLNSGGNGYGAVFLFQRSGGVWKQRQKLTAADTYSGQGFGHDVLIDGRRVFITQTEEEVPFKRPVYIFHLDQTVPADFDGDRKTDVSVFRPSSAVWYLLGSQNGAVASTQFGLSSDTLAPADYDGDGVTDIAVFRQSNGVWYGLFSSTNTYESIQFGMNGDVAVPGDYDGDGLTDVAVFRPSNSVWYRQNSSDGQFVAETFGASGDVPVAADYDGDGRADKAIFRPSNGEWWIDRSALGISALTFGTGTDKPVPADYTGDGRADVAIFRPATGEWFVLRSEDYTYYAFPFGLNGDVPAPGDYDGDSLTDAAVFRPSTGTWYLLRSGAGFASFQFGSSGDRPLPGN